jgi:hypothetical protein
MGTKSTLLLIFTALLLAGCPGKLAPTPAQTDTPALSEIAEAIASGVVQATYTQGYEARGNPEKKNSYVAKLIESNLRLIPNAEAALAGGPCPSFQDASGVLLVPTATPNTACGPIAPIPANPNGAFVLSLGWGPCYIGQPYGTWSGGQNLTLMPPSLTAMSCGPPATSFANGDVVHRWFNSPTSRIFNLYNPNGTITDIPGVPITYFPVTVLVDTYAATQQYGATPLALQYTTVPLPSVTVLANVLPNYAFTGYLTKFPTSGETVIFTNGTGAASITVDGIHLAGEKSGYVVWDYTVSTADPTGISAAVPIATDGAGNITAGVLYIQDNRNFLTVKSTLTNLTFNGGCGVPTGGAGGVTTILVNQGGTATYANESLTAFQPSCGPNGATLTQGSSSGPTNLIYAF